ncbi:MAG: TIGR00730 family Rossman fold protein [Verrucomicrobiales bacterium]
MKKGSEFKDRDFTGGGIYALPHHHGSTGDEEFDRRIAGLVEDWGCGSFNELVEELIITVLKIGKDDIGVGEIKLMSRTLKEMRAANRVFWDYGDHRKVVVYGSARTAADKPEAQAAQQFSRRMAKHGFMTITGAGDGIMGAAQKGAGRENSFGLNIKLPFEQDANETIIGDDKLLTFNYFFTRKLTFVKEADAIALFPGGFGTMDECFEALTLMQTGKALIYPVVMVDAPGGSYWKTFLQFLREHLCRLELISEEDLEFIRVTDSVDEAVEEILNFYKLFHSYRSVGKQLVIRIRNRLTESALAKLNDEFSDLLASGQFEQGESLPAEADEEAILELPRIICTPVRRSFGRFRLLIDAINASETAAD